MPWREGYGQRMTNILVRQLEKDIRTIEFRHMAPVAIVEENESLWTRFKETPKVLRSDVVATVERAFEHGGYVAGGCARWLRGDREITALKRGSYVHEGGDIDLFFRTEEGWRAFVEPYIDNESHDQGPMIALSNGKLAANLTFCKHGGGYNGTPTVQAIRCSLGEPDHVIRTFDFVNSMVAFDQQRTWVADEWDRVEREKDLHVAWWGSRSIPFRVRKYVNKYGYKKLVNRSNAMFDQLVAGTNSMDDARKHLTRSVWTDILHMPLCSLDMKLTILASTAQGIDTNDLFTYAKDGPTNLLWSGSYENTIKNLLDRQARAASRPIRNEWDDPIGFDADEYCWAV